MGSANAMEVMRALHVNRESVQSFRPAFVVVQITVIAINNQDFAIACQVGTVVIALMGMVQLSTCLKCLL